jgi:hypothetical protein
LAFLARFVFGGGNDSHRDNCNGRIGREETRKHKNGNGHSNDKASRKEHKGHKNGHGNAPELPRPPKGT